MMSGKEFNEIFKEISFVKLTNQNSVHNGFKFVEGLNIDVIKFKPTHRCGPGGFYFCEYSKFGDWINYNKNIGMSMYIWDVVIPNDAKIFVLRNKIKCDKFIISNKQYIWNNYTLCLEAVKQNGWNLQWVSEQTEELCSLAIKQNGDVLMLVENQTEKLCLESVQCNGLNLFNVKTKTLRICDEAIKQNQHARRWAQLDKKSKSTCIIM